MFCFKSCKCKKKEKLSERDILLAYLDDDFRKKLKEKGIIKRLERQRMKKKH